MADAGNDTNSTAAPEMAPSKLLIANQVIIIITLVVMMFGMGATITLREVWENCKKPIGPVIGICCQFLISPFLGWSLAMAVDLPPAAAIGALAIATCPGGTFSNVLTYLTDGDTCLSIVMTTFSTFFAIGFMPLWLFVYSRSWIDAAAALPYRDIIIALVLILIPGGLGMLVKWKLPKYSDKTALACSIFTLIGITVTLVLIGFMNPLMFSSSWRPYIVGFFIPFLAFGLGYLIPWALRQSHKKCRTISFETGIQNTALALVVLNLAEIRNQQGGLASSLTRLVPALQGLFSFLIGMTVICVYLAYKKFYKKGQVGPEEDAEAVKEGESHAASGGDGGVVNEGYDAEDGETTGVDAPEKTKGDGDVENHEGAASSENAKETNQ